jgi:hypothetical protein
MLVLQPKVEAFFLVYAAVISSEEKKKPKQKETRSWSLSKLPRLWLVLKRIFRQILKHTELF